MEGICLPDLSRLPTGYLVDLDLVVDLIVLVILISLRSEFGVAFSTRLGSTKAS